VSLEAAIAQVAAAELAVSMCADDVHSKSASGCLHSNHRLFFSIFSFPSMKMLPKYEIAALAINHADVGFPVVTACRGTSLGVNVR
jgi:hypothetical protein